MFEYVSKKKKHECRRFMIDKKTAGRNSILVVEPIFFKKIMIEKKLVANFMEKFEIRIFLFLCILTEHRNKKKKRNKI